MGYQTGGGQLQDGVGKLRPHIFRRGYNLGLLMLLFGWDFENQMGEKIRISLRNVKTNSYISDEIFKTDTDYEKVKK